MKLLTNKKIILTIIFLLYGLIYLNEITTMKTLNFHTNRTYIRESNTINDIPLTIYSTWHSHDVPKNMYNAVQNLLKMNPEFEYYLYSESDCRNFIEKHFEKDVVNAFDALKPLPYKSDLWRYCVLYKMGGAYLDIKYYSIIPLINIIKKYKEIFVRDINMNCSNEFTGIYNAFIVSPPNNPTFRGCIDTIVNNCKLKLYKASPLDVTGPCLLANVLMANMKSQNEKKKYTDSLDFYHKVDNKNLEIWYKDQKLFIGYYEYREDQKKFQKSEYYSVMWEKKDIYN
jgi:mannosyltransferase OCH1-like enzyme